MRKNRRLSLIVIIVASDNIQKKILWGFLFFPFIHPFGRPFPYTLITLLSMLWKEVNVLHEKNLLIAVSCSFFFLFGNIIGLRWKFFFFRKAMSCGVSKERKKLIKGIVTNDFGIFLLFPTQNCFCNNKFEEFASSHHHSRHPRDDFFFFFFLAHENVINSH